jgi:hypothetical protein
MLRLHIPLIKPDVRFSRIRLSDRCSRFRPRKVSQGTPLVELALNSPLQALSTAVVALLMLAAFREWFALRLDV